MPIEVKHALSGFRTLRADQPFSPKVTPFAQALLVDSPILSYIDVRHADFLPLNFTAGKAWDISCHHTCSDEPAPIRDESVELVSQSLRERALKAIQDEAPTEQLHIEEQ